MTEDEFKKRAKAMGYGDEFINDTIYRHKHDKFVLPYEEELIGIIDNYPSSNE